MTSQVQEFSLVFVGFTTKELQIRLIQLAREIEKTSNLLENMEVAETIALVDFNLTRHE